MVACASRILRLNLYQSCLNGERFQPFFVSTIAVFRASFLRRWKHLFYNRTTHFSTFNGHSRIAMTNININIRIIIKCGWLAVFIIISIKLYSNIYSEKKTQPFAKYDEWLHRKLLWVTIESYFKMMCVRVWVCGVEVFHAACILYISTSSFLSRGYWPYNIPTILAMTFFFRVNSHSHQFTACS